MMNRRPNWYAASCGIAYMVCFLLLPVYTIAYVGSVSGLRLLFKAPAVLILLLCGMAMIAGSLLLDRRISIGIGAGSAVITLLYGMLGSHVLPMGVIADLIARSTNRLFRLDMGLGLILCLLLCVAHAVLEVLLEGRRPKKIQADLWEDATSGPIDF